MVVVIGGGVLSAVLAGDALIHDAVELSRNEKKLAANVAHTPVRSWHQTRHIRLLDASGPEKYAESRFSTGSSLSIPASPAGSLGCPGTG
jgi:hypothetical protein